MLGERWREIEAAYHDVLACPKEERTEAVNSACGEDTELRNAVESLLEANDSADGFLSPTQWESQVLEAASDLQDLPAGYRIDHYEVISRIGSGGMGTVYLARDERLDRRIALKLLRPHLSHDAQGQRRFVREAKAASALNHPNILTVYEIGTEGELQYLAMELIEGVTLRQRLAAGPMELQQALDIGTQCCAALKAAHDAGIVHRDIKPENIMLRPDGLVKVLDFGLARIAAVRESESGEDVPAVLGTPSSMSPEQAQGKKVDARTDIFSLGTVIYEMVAGYPAFGGSSASAVIAALLGSEPKRLPQPLQDVLASALTKDPEQRYADIAQFGAALTRLKKQSGTGRAQARPRTMRDSLAPLLAAALAGAGGVALWTWAPWEGTPRIAPQVMPITSFEGFKDHASLSPDGQQLAFAWSGGGDGKRDIYVMAVSGGDPVRLTKAPQDDWLPAWSEDGRRIAFLRNMGSHNAALIIPAGGGPEQQVAEAGPGLTWGPGGRSIIIAGAKEDRGTLVEVTLGTGARRRITVAGAHTDTFPAVSPNGKRVAFVRNLTASTREVFVAAINAGQVRQLTFDRRPVMGLTWTADSREVIFSSGRLGGGDGLWRIDATGGNPSRLLLSTQSAYYPSVSRTGQRLAFTERFFDTNIYLQEGTGFAGRDVPGPFGPSRGLILSSREDSSPQFSPDGERIVFVSKRTGSEEIWVCARNGAQPKQLTNFGGTANGTPHWSPDGRWIAFDSREAGSPDIYVVGAEGGPARQLTTEPSNELLPSWSGDGKWIYFCSGRTGEYQIWKAPFSGGGAVQITRGGGWEALEAPGGERLFYMKSGQPGFWTVPVQGGTEALAPGLEQVNPTRFWGIVREGLYYLPREDGQRPRVRFYSFKTHTTTILTELDRQPSWPTPGLALSPDGKRLLSLALDHEVNDIMLIENLR